MSFAKSWPRLAARKYLSNSHRADSKGIRASKAIVLLMAALLVVSGGALAETDIDTDDGGGGGGSGDVTTLPPVIVTAPDPGGDGDGDATTLPPVNVTANRAPDPVETLGTIVVTGEVPPSAVAPPIHIGKTPSSVTTLAPVTVNATIPKTKSQCQVGDPIDLGTQAKIEAKTDFSRPGEMGLKFVRYYSSNAQNQTAFGTNLRVGAWTTSYDYILTLDRHQNTNCNYLASNSTCPLVLVRPDGATVEFAPGVPNADGSASFAELNGGTATMTRGSNGSYTIHDENSKVLQFGPAIYGGNFFSITSITDLAGVGWTFTYPDANDTVVTHTSGQTVTLHWTDTVSGFGDFGQTINRQLTVTDPSGKVYTYSTTIPQGSIGNVVGTRYLTGELQSVTFPDSPATVIAYKYQSDVSNANGLYGYYQYALNEVDYDSVVHDTTSYNAMGQASQTMRGDGTDKVSISYASNSTGVVATETNPLGHVSVYQFDGNDNILSVTGQAASQCDASFSSQTYDVNGNVKTQTDSNGNVTTYTYAANGQLQQKVEGTGAPVSRTTNYVWDATSGADRLTSITVVGVLQTAFTYTPQGRIATVTRTNLTGNGVPGQAHQTTYTYTLYGNGMVASVKITPPDTTNTQTYTYDTLGNISSMTDGLNRVTTYNSYDGLGRPTRMTDMNGVITDYVYTTREWLASKTVRANANGTPSAVDAVTKYTFFNLPYDVITSVTDPDGITTNLSYDSAQRLTRITDAMGNYVQYTLDADGNQTERAIYNSSNQATSFAYQQFNVLGQLISTSNAAGIQVMSYAYDPNGNLTDATDANGIDTHRTYDSLNRLQSTIQNFNGADTATKNATTTFGYDAQGDIVSVNDPNGLTTSYGTDGFGQIWAVNSPDSGETHYTFDGGGRRTSKTDARGVEQTYTYDAVSRVTGIQYPAHPALNVTYNYDQADPVAICSSNFNKGHMTSMSDETGTMGWCYTNVGDKAMEQKVLDGGTYTTIITKTLGRRTKNIQYPSLSELTFGLDADGRVSSINFQQNNVTNNGFQIIGSVTPIISNVGYLPFGPMTSYTWAQTGSPTESLSYDGNYFLTDIVSPKLNLHFARDILGEILAEGTAAGANPATETFQYDPLHRVKGIEGSTGVLEQSFTYSGSGDRLSKSVTGSPIVAYAYTSGTHQLSAVGANTMQTDAMGNVMVMTAPNNEVIGIDYDDRGYVAGVTNATTSVANYHYNGFGQRVTRTVTVAPFDQVKYIYEPDGSNHIVGEYFTSDHREYIYLNGIPVASVYDSSPQSAGVIQDFYADQNGAIRAATDTLGNLVYSWNWNNNAFGEAAATGSSTYYTRFPGQLYDDETGLFYNGHRYYNPSTGRYIQSDPLGLAGGISTYAYAGGNPLSNVDPNGDAYFALRPLNGLPWLGLASNNSLDAAMDDQVAHEQLFFEDGKSPGNLGFFPNGVHSDSYNGTWHKLPGEYNDCVIRQAVNNVSMGQYHLFGNNCQTWADMVRATYNQLVLNGALSSGGCQ